MLPAEAIQEYQDIYQKLYGKAITCEQATKSANKLINLVMVIDSGNVMENANESSHNS